jgi:hypothetical protein
MIQYTTAFRIASNGLSTWTPTEWLNQFLLKMAITYKEQLSHKMHITHKKINYTGLGKPSPNWW